MRTQNLLNMFLVFLIQFDLFMQDEKADKY